MEKFLDLRDRMSAERVMGDEPGEALIMFDLWVSLYYSATITFDMS